MHRMRAVIQCRLSSSRLPAKAMLMVGGMPSIVLCARRAANAGLEVVVATSNEASDDPLAALLASERIRCVRGPLDDVLARFTLATDGMSDDDGVYRLTADNLIPDGSFLEEMAESWNAHGRTYVGTHSPLDGQPYGLSAELTSVGLLREAAREATAPLDREWVTPWIVRKVGERIFRSSRFARDLAHLRCTLDTFQDYQRLCRVFAQVDDAVHAPVTALVDALQRDAADTTFRVPFHLENETVHSAMVLGSAQLGLSYGVARARPQPTMDETRALVKAALEHGVTAIDTARVYGDAESRLGQILDGGLTSQVTVVTKLAPLEELAESSSEQAVRDAVDASVLRSCRELRLRALPTLLLHRAHHRASHGGAIWRRLLELKSEGVVQKLGVSCCTPDEALAALEDPVVEHLQIPFNAVDERWHRSGFPERRKVRPDMVVHARSALLQGVLAADESWWPANEPDASRWIARLDELARRFERADRADLCLAYVRSQDWITSIVVGVETMSQLRRNFELFRTGLLTPDACEQIRRSLTGASPTLLDPAVWTRRR